MSMGSAAARGFPGSGTRSTAVLSGLLRSRSRTGETRRSLAWIFPSSPHLGLPSANELEADEQWSLGGRRLHAWEAHGGSGPGDPIRLRLPCSE